MLRGQIGRLKREKCARIEMRWTQHNTGCIQERSAKRNERLFFLLVKWTPLAKRLRKGAEKSCYEMRISCCFSNELSPVLSVTESALGTTWHGCASAVISGDKSDQRSGNPVNTIDKLIYKANHHACLCLLKPVWESMLWDDEQTADKVRKQKHYLSRNIILIRCLYVRLSNY